MSNPIYDMDRAIAAASQSAAIQHNATLHALSDAFNWWGGTGVICFAALLWLGGRAIKQTRVSLIGLRGAEAIALSSSISGIAKGLAGRARPHVTPDAPWNWSFLHGWADADYFSMPSGHTTATFAFAAALIVASARIPSAPRGAAIVASVLAAMFVAEARIYSNNHWFSDVLAGAVLGVTTGFLLTRWHARNPKTAFDRMLLGAHAAEQA